MTTSHSVPLHRLQGLRLADVAPCFVQGINHEFRETDYQAKSSMSDMGLFPVIKAWALPNEKGRHGMVTQRLGNVLPHLPRWPAFRDGLGGSLNRENLAVRLILLLVHCGGVFGHQTTPSTRLILVACHCPRL